MTVRLSEEDLASAVVAWLGEMHWEVYQEVTSRGGPRCDIVAVQGPVVWAIECKVSMSLAVIAQAMYWRGRAHRVSVATGWPGATNATRPILSEFGIGALRVDQHRVCEALAAPLRRRISPSLRDALREEHKTYAAAGNARGDYWSPFKATCKAVRDFVDRAAQIDAGPVTLKQVIEGIRHHYANPASARQHLRDWIEAGKLEGVALRRDGRQLFVELAP